MLKFDEVENLDEMLKSGKSGLRYEEMVELLKKGIWSIKELSEEIGIDRKNVSSVKNKCKKEGYLLREIKSGKDVLVVLVGKIVNGKKGLDGYVKEVEGKSHIENWDGKNGKWVKEVSKKK